MNRFLILLALPLFVSCIKKEEGPTFNEFPDSEIQGVHPDMLPFFQEFEDEANRRGFTYRTELNALVTRFEDIEEQGVIGRCNWNSHAPDVVTIDIVYWNNVGDSDREFVIFHELGHCVLGRGHDESENDNGLCLSIMASGTGNCVGAYSTLNRAYYLDELFFDAIP